MTDRIKYRAFSKSYNKSVSKLITPVGILPVLTVGKVLSTVPVEATALWDTGATATCIKPALVERLKMRLLSLSNKTTLSGIGGKVAARITMINLFLSPVLEVDYRPVYVADFPGFADILIGMDIIGKGDFAVCNTGNKTLFSFAMPSLPDRIDLAEKAEAANRKMAG